MKKIVCEDFVVTLDKGCITVKNEELGWSLKIGKNLMMYKSLEPLFGNDAEAEDVIRGLAVQWLTETTMLWDGEYMRGKIQLQEEYFKRVEGRKPTADEQDANMLIGLGGEA